MKTKLMKMLPTIGVLAAMILGLFAVNAYAQQSTYGIDTTGRGVTVSSTDLVSNIKNIINFVLGVLGLIAVVMIIYAGIRLTSSAGDEGAKDLAKKIITYSLVGLVLVALSWVIVEFVTRALISAETGQQAT